MQERAKMDLIHLCWKGVYAIKEEMEASEKHVKQIKSRLANLIDRYGEDALILKEVEENLATWEDLYAKDKEDYTAALKIYNEVEKDTK